MRDYPLLTTNDAGTVCDERGYPLMQYTGLNDKNGKEIFERDIVRADFWSFGTKTRKQCTVKYLNEDVAFSISGLEDIEIIGNIYENSDLLTNEEK
jgi:hypothetical protein